MPGQATFDPNQWKSFRQLNAVVASETLNLCGQSFPTLCWVHDYQLPLVTPTISVQAGIIPCHFWHVPWPAPEILAGSPIGPELVEAMLANRLIGFQTTEYATNFLNTVQELFPQAVVDVLRMEVKHGRLATTNIAVLPYGIDSNFWQDLAKHSRPLAHVLAKKYKGAGRRLVLAIDRLGRNKGILEKLDGFEEFLAKSPHWNRRLQYVQITYPADTNELSASEYPAQVADRIAAINARYSDADWQPLVHLPGYLSESELAAWYQVADVLAINSLSEGLSLIAKEYVACRLDDQGALLLSRKSGSISELGQGAIAVDPLSKQDFARALLQAVSMSKEESRRRMQQMKRVVGWNNLQDWAIRFLTQALSENRI
jgi:trehalose 6-phosphate synthase